MVDRALILPQKQAYQGAKSFFTCFLPLVLTLIIITDLYVQSLTNWLLIITASFSYAVSLKYYILCNTIDTTVNIQGNQQMISNISQFEQQISFTNNNNNNNNNNNTGNKAQNQPISTNQSTNLTQSKSSLSSSSLSSHSSSSSHNLQKPAKYVCKKCFTNNKPIPYRSKHCRKCQTCIQRYDHHCFWIGNCVGYKNHRQFYLFLLLQSINNISHFILIRSLHISILQQKILEYEIGIGDVNGRVYFWGNLILYILQIGAFGFIIFTTYLLLYHTMLMMTGMTTWQHMSRSRVTYLKYLPAGVNPFSKGVINNIKQFWIHQQFMIQYDIPTYQQARLMGPHCGIIQNQYYSCC